MILDLDRLHKPKSISERRTGKTVEACALVAGAVGVLPPGNTVFVFIKYMERVKHFTRTLFEVLQAMQMELPTRKGDDLYFKHRDIRVKFVAVGDGWDWDERQFTRGYPEDIQPIYDLD